MEEICNVRAFIFRRYILGLITSKYKNIFIQTYSFMNYVRLLLTAATFASAMACNEDPTPEVDEPRNIVQTALETQDLSVLAQAVTRAGLVESLSGPGPLTVLAPTNQAFQALLDSNPEWNSLDDIDDETLQAVLLYHVFSGAVNSASLQADQELESLNSEVVTVTQVSPNVVFNSRSRVVTADVEASNGVVHLIDAVLLPPSWLEQQRRTLSIVDTEEYGLVFTDGEGRTLYFFARDVNGSNNCSGGCANNWPVFHAASTSLGDQADNDLVGEIEVGEASQSTYNGWPLYYFVNDEDPGDTNGEGAGGGNWYVAKPDYSVMLANGQLIGNDGNNYVLNDEGAIVAGTGNSFYFTDFAGRTLYRFINDGPDQSNFGGNAANWPDFTTEVNVAPSIISVEDFGVIADGQITYRRNPLYYFGQDTQRGETRGVNVPNPGVWPAVNLTTPVRE